MNNIFLDKGERLTNMSIQMAAPKSLLHFRDRFWTHPDLGAIQRPLQTRTQRNLRI